MAYAVLREPIGSPSLKSVAFNRWAVAPCLHCPQGSLMSPFLMIVPNIVLSVPICFLKSAGLR